MKKSTLDTPALQAAGAAFIVALVLANRRLLDEPFALNAFVGFIFGFVSRHHFLENALLVFTIGSVAMIGFTIWSEGITIVDGVLWYINFFSFGAVPALGFVLIISGLVGKWIRKRLKK